MRRVRKPSGRVVILDDDFRVSLDDDFRRVGSSFIMMRGVAGRDRVPNMSIKIRRFVRIWFSQLSVVALGCLAFIDIWRLPLRDAIPGSRLINTIIYLLICLILLWRQRMP